VENKKGDKWVLLKKEERKEYEVVKTSDMGMYIFRVPRGTP
jgi:hypothetical protein